MSFEDRFAKISLDLKKGVVPPTETVRTLLGWFDASRRGSNVSAWIKEALAAHGLKTEPDFDSAYIDGPVKFIKASAVHNEKTVDPDPTHRIARLASANRPPSSVKPNADLSEIVTLMMSHDYSQVPVMTTSRELKGIVSWKTIGSKLALGCPAATAQDCMEPAREVGIGDSLSSAISVIAQCDYVLVRAKDEQICGIVTAADLTEQFQKLSEPFLLVGEIENGIRRLLHGRFTKEELATVKDAADSERVVEAIAHLTFGEYARLLEPEENWLKLQLKLDRAEFIKRLHQIRKIRNDVMHFDPDGLGEVELKSLREFCSFLRRLREVGAA